MNLNLTSDIIIYIITAAGVVFLLFGFYLIKPLAAIVGFLLGYKLSLIYMPVATSELMLISIIVGFVAGFIMFTAHLILPFMIGTGFVFVICATLIRVVDFPVETYHYVLFLLLALLTGLTAFVSKDYFSVIWTALLGAAMTAIGAGFLFFSQPGAFITHTFNDIYNSVLGLVMSAPYRMLIIFAAMLIIGLLFQFLLTTSSQLFIRRRYIGRHRKA